MTGRLVRRGIPEPHYCDPPVGLDLRVGDEWQCGTCSGLWSYTHGWFRRHWVFTRTVGYQLPVVGVNDSKPRPPPHPRALRRGGYEPGDFTGPMPSPTSSTPKAAS